MKELTARAKSVIKLSDGVCLLDITMPKGNDIIKGINEALPFVGITDTLCWASQVKAVELDLGLAELSVKAKLGLLTSCEDALADRDAQIEGLCSVLKDVAGLVDTDMGDVADWLIDNTDHIRRLIGEVGA
jgi:hypothetical protein